MRVLEGLDPKGVFSIFEDICQIPHGSGNTDALGDWLMDFAKSRGLKCEKDQIGNVTIIKEATEGYESVEPVTLQAHMDMVCEKTPNCTKDMAKEGLDLAVDGDIVYAKETSLGGDDGIGVAIILALMDDASLKHPKLQGIFTVEEETGLYGAEAYDMERVSGARFINLDSEEEGIMSISSAGGVNVNAEIPVARLASSAKTWRIDLKDLTGGHSGMEINNGLGNANKLMATLLNKLIKIEDTKLIAVEGGSFDNVISPSAYAIIACDREEEMRSACEEYLKFFQHKYKADPNMKLVISQVDETENPMDDDSALRIISFLESSPNGVQMMTPGFPDLPQTSLNLGVVRTKSDKVEFIFCLRSSVDEDKEVLAVQLELMITVYGGTSTRDCEYPGWEYKEDSYVRDSICRVYEEVTGQKMMVQAIHAGLECGYFVSKRHGLDCVSIGPEINDVHSPKETINIQSVQRLWKVLVQVLEQMKQ